MVMAPLPFEAHEGETSKLNFSCGIKHMDNCLLETPDLSLVFKPHDNITYHVAIQAYPAVALNVLWQVFCTLSHYDDFPGQQTRQTAS
jgi:hypothetical protein